jgi:SpoVK/Ycf46/Vps4 family AAA+-type ATPase
MHRNLRRMVAIGLWAGFSVMSIQAVAALETREITARDAVKIARDAAKLDNSFEAWHELKSDVILGDYYVVDFVKCDEGDTTCYFKRRILVNPVTGVVEDDPSKLREWKALDGDVPDRFDPFTKVERERPINRPVITKREAALQARRALGMGEDVGVWVNLKTDSLGTVRYVVDFINVKGKNEVYWKSRAIVNPFNGTIETDPQILDSFHAAKGQLPDDFRVVKGSGLIVTPEMQRMFVFLAWWALSILVLVGLAYRFRRRIAKWTVIDWCLCGFTVLLFMMTGLVFSIAPNQPWYGFMCLGIAISCMTVWMLILEQKRLFGIYDEQDIQPIKAADLHSFKAVGGMDEVKEALKESIGRMIKCRDLAARHSIALNGILLYGPPGTGKTYIAKACAGQFGLNFIDTRVSDMTSSLFGGSVRKIDNAFKSAIKAAPCILFLDEIESLGSRRGNSGSSMMEDTRITNHLLHWLEKIRQKKTQVFVFAATNRKEDLDQALIRSGRFDKHIYVPLPDQKARESILTACIARRMKSEQLDTANLAARMDGMSAANIDAVVVKACLAVLDRAEQGNLVLTNQDLVQSVQNFRTTRKNTVKPMTWDSVVLQQETKDEIVRLVKVIENPEITRQLGINPPKGVLLYGPPGTGKTTIAKIIAHEARASFFAINQSDIYSKWLGESQQNVSRIFEEARSVRPSIIFIDEIEALMGARGRSEDANYRDKIVSHILQEIDGLEDAANIFIIGATNAPDQVDTALLRGGRLSIQVEIPIPGRAERKQLFNLFLSKVKLADGVDIDKLIDLTEGYSGADIREVCDRAILDTYDSGRVGGVSLSHAGLLSAISGYAKRSAVYRVPDQLKKTKIGFAA